MNCLNVVVSRKHSELIDMTAVNCTKDHRR